MVLYGTGIYIYTVISGTKFIPQAANKQLQAMLKLPSYGAVLGSPV